MTPVKRIEVILAEALVQPFLEVLEAHSFSAYTVSGGLSGASRSGHATVGLSDAVVTVICGNAEASKILPSVEAFLKRYGGVGCVTDGQGLNTA
jgi:hypothetical protein